MNQNTHRSTQRVRFWSKLRTRMAVSYVAATLVIVLLMEALLVIGIYLLIARSPFLSWLAMERADQAARLYALQAAFLGGGDALNQNITFQPGQPGSITPFQSTDTPQLSQFRLEVPYVEPGGSPPDRTEFGLLIDAGGKVIASSYPDRYPAGVDADQVIAGDLAMVRAALAGKSGATVKDTSEGQQAVITRTIFNRSGEPLGAVYIQTPAGIPPEAGPLAPVVSILIPSGIAWLCLMLPLGLVFGFLTTRGTIRRIERLAGATARFTGGDFSQRVPVGRGDEIGQLETQFNGMAEQLLDSFAQRQALAEQSARLEERARIEQEMSTAHYIQQSLLPKAPPSISGWQIEPFYRPAREVGGDLYDFLPLADGRLGIVIGDVTGKGMPAALIMATTCTMVRAATADGAASPGEILSRVNDLLHRQIIPGMFVTCFFAILDFANSRLCFANAGHDLPYLARDGEVIELRATGMPLGLMPEQPYEEGELGFSGNDMILFYTDGLVEAHNTEREMFSFPRLQQLIKDCTQPDHLIDHLLTELRGFTGDEWDQEDDITLVVVRKR